jgi:hypothetical protein
MSLWSTARSATQPIVAIAIAVGVTLLVLGVAYGLVGTFYYNTDFSRGSVERAPAQLVAGQMRQYLGGSPTDFERVETLHAGHALRNAGYLAGAAMLTTALIACLTVVVPIGVIAGLVTANWEWVGVSLLGAIGALLAGFAGIFAYAVAWFGGFFQSITPGFALVWLFVGLPLFLIGLISGAATGPTIVVLAVYRR